MIDERYTLHDYYYMGEGNGKRLMMPLMIALFCIITE